MSRVAISVFLFHRDGFFYPVEYPRNYNNWQAEADRNPGTTKITDATGKQLWPMQTKEPK